MVDKHPHLDAHGLGEPLDDGQQGVGGQHRGLYTQLIQGGDTVYARVREFMGDMRTEI